MNQQSLHSQVIAALSTVLHQKGKAAPCPTREKLPLVKGESLDGHKGCLHLYLSQFWFPDQSLEQILRFVYCLQVLVLKTSREKFEKSVHCIKWKTLIWLSVNEMALGSRRKTTPALSDATRDSSDKTLQKDTMWKALHHQKLSLANHHSPLNHLCPKDTFCPWKLQVCVC